MDVFMKALPGPVLEPMQASEGQAVDQIKVFDVRLKSRGNQFGFRYSNAQAFPIQSLNPTFPSCIDDVRRALMNGSSKAPKFLSIDRKPSRPRVNLSLSTPVAVQSDKGKAGVPESSQCIYLFRLHQRRLDWRFSTSFAPFSLAGTQRQVDLAATVFKNGFYFVGDPSSSDSYIEIPEIAGGPTHLNPYQPTAVAGFTFDHEKFKEIFSADGGNGDGVIPFNFHVEARGNRQRLPTEPNDWFTEYVPIIIDPDIGHPGGNNTGP